MIHIPVSMHIKLLSPIRVHTNSQSNLLTRRKERKEKKTPQNPTLNPPQHTITMFFFNLPTCIGGCVRACVSGMKNRVIIDIDPCITQPPTVHTTHHTVTTHSTFVTTEPRQKTKKTFLTPIWSFTWGKNKIKNP